MELMFDNANLETIKEFADIYPYVGVTSNPTNYIENAVTTFAEDWESSQGTKSILDCE